jgi:hypothetical protein
VTPGDGALRAFARRRLLEWSGLEHGTTPADVARHFAVVAGFEGAAPLGERYEPAEWVGATGAGFPSGIRVWLRDGRVVLLDAEGFEPSGPVDALLDGLGEPAARRDAFLGPIEIPGSEWVYPERGLTLYVNPETRVVDRVLAYAPTTLDAYEAELRPHTGVAPVPERRDEP